MKQAKASDQEWEKLFKWLNALEEKGEDVPDWRRVIFGYQVLVEHCCDPTLDYLEFKPEILQAMKTT